VTDDLDFSDFDAIFAAALGTDPGPVAAPKPGVHLRVVLLPDEPKINKEAELIRIMPQILTRAVERLNPVLEGIMPGFAVRFIARGQRIHFECAVPDLLDFLPPSVVADLQSRIDTLFPLLGFGGDHVDLLSTALTQLASDLTEFLTDHERKSLLKSDLEARHNSPLQRLKEDDRKLLEQAIGEMPVVGPMDVDGVDELWSDVHAGAPWLQVATTEAWKAMRHEIAQGRGAFIPPLLLHGDPGPGKTTLGRSLAQHLGVPLVEIDAGSGTAAFQLAGLEKGWGNAEPGLPIEAILRHRVANPVILVNEICRAGSGMTSGKGARTSLSDALLALLDRGSSRRWRCPALRIDFDLSRVIWILTANRLDTIDPALLSRVRCVQVPKPTATHVAQIVRRRLADIDEELAGRAAGMIAANWENKSLTLRHVEAECERVRRALTGPRLH
jgi:hypothetical protein